MSGFAPSSHLTFHRRYNQVKRKLKNEHIPESLVQHVDQYFEYEWAASQGFEEDVLMKELPTSIQSDIMLSRYQDMIEGCLLFREKDGRIDIAMTNSIFRLMKVEVFMHNEFLLKIG